MPGNRRRLSYYNSFTADIHKSIGSTQINSNIVGEKSKEPVDGIYKFKMFDVKLHSNWSIPIYQKLAKGYSPELVEGFLYLMLCYNLSRG